MVLLNACASTQIKIPKETKRIVFIGDSITYAGHYVAYVEAYLKVAHPENEYEIINIGLPSETVSGLSEVGHAGGAFPRPDAEERLQRSLDELKPELVFSCYGINDGIYLPFDENRFKAYQQGVTNLHNTVTAEGTELIHLTPPDYDGDTSQNYSAVLDQYSVWLQTQSVKQNWQVIDIHFPMQNKLQLERKVNPEFYYAKDGVHPNIEGHWQIAKALLQGLGEPVLDTFEQSIGALNPKIDAQQLYTLIKRRQSLLSDAYLTQIGHKRPRMKVGLPLPQALAAAQAIDNDIAKLFVE